VYTQTTHNIKVTVFPVYLEAQSVAEDSHFVWAYTILIENLGNSEVQLISRHWEITDANGQVEHVRGLGVVGEQPVIEASKAVQYTSGVHLHTKSGIMRGTYDMKAEDGSMFTIEIPVFSLDSTEQKMRPN
jgi:ApaG protein